MCHQSVGLIARHAEAAGISTLSMSSCLDITKAANPPRTAFLNFPLGHTSGKPNEPALQREIIKEALGTFTSFNEPGLVKTLPFQWSDDTSWKEALFKDDQRLPRYDTPQYQTEEDRSRAETHDLSASAVCGCAVCSAVQ